MLPIMVAFAAAMSLVCGGGTNQIFILIAVMGIMGISLTVLMGFSGQISLGHWGLAGLGAYTTANLYTRVGLPWVVSVILAVMVGMAVSLLIGLPALRIRGLYLAIATLAFNLAAETLIFKSNLFAGSSAGVPINPPKLGFLDLDSTTKRPLFFLCMALLLVCGWLARNLSRSRSGRGMFALRENEKAAATLGVGLTQYKLLAFAVSGGIAALAGALYGTDLKTVQSSTWQTQTSLLLVAMVVIGGLGSMSGAVLGAFVMFGLPQLVHFENQWIVPIGTGILLIVVITRAPGGIAGALQRLKHGAVETLDEIDRTSVVEAPAAAPAR
jgi:branched-chain amino acid transport system permease protein